MERGHTLRPDLMTKGIHVPVLLLSLLAALPARGAEPSSKAPSPSSVNSVAPEAVSAVERMGEFLASTRAFSVHAETSTDEVLAGGAKIQYLGSIDMTVRWPDRLRVTFQRDGRNPQEYFYDGSTLTVWFPVRRYWASIPAPGNIPDLIELMRQKYGLELPLQDLLLEATKKQLLQGIEAGIVVGPSRVAGVECEHLGFHEADVDWQIWIASGEQPLPRKFLITTLGEATQPQHGELLTWDLSPKIDEGTFTFVPPAGAERIVFAEGPRPKDGKRVITPATPKSPTTKTEGAP
jgi:hypothetical protein